MIVALAQINPVVGDFSGNLQLAVEAIRQAKKRGAALVVLPELATMGYPPRDLLLREGMVERNLDALNEIARACEGISAIVGYVGQNTSEPGLPLRNAAAVCSHGQVASRHYKSLLPNYDVFDERRYFQPASNITLGKCAPAGGPALSLGITLCEDLWNDQQFIDRRHDRSDPIKQAVDQGADLLINISASPFWIGKQTQRLKVFSQQVQEHGAPLVYVNQVGGNDELIFDGASMVFDKTGRLIAQAKAFEEDLLVVDINQPNANHLTPYPDDLDSLIQGLVLGTRDYVRKCGFKEVVLGLSGGIDSALTAVIGAQALGPTAVHAVAMPSRYSSEHSLEDALALAGNLGIDYRVIPIDKMHSAAEATLDRQFSNCSTDATEENIQARIRGQILMALSNKFGWLLLTTGNKSELAVGYCTLYGDMCGGLAVISDVAKTTIFEMAKRINTVADRDIIPDRILVKPPSAELKPNQTDQDSLPPYEILDEILLRYVERQESSQQITSAGFDERIVNEVIRKVDLNEYKRRQAAPGLKVTSRAFGVGWRMPIAARFSNH